MNTHRTSLSTRLLAVVAMAFMLFPLLTVIPVSFTSKRFLSMPEGNWSLRHYENRVPPGARHSVGRIALIVIMVTMVSHALRDQIKDLVDDQTKVVYLRTASVSALRAAVEQHAE